ncbi:MAG: bifunctional 4-hydroxy-2-oxoglutarate aldolase/2-dehydro-3-deoxy-phosphogluconate aldolase [Acidobacteriota bacterium]|jgi:Entner-Doudoroff aldolase
MNPEQLVETLWQERAVAILRADDHLVCRDAMGAAVEGGFRFVEFTLTCPEPFALIEQFAAREGVVVGAGTVLTPADARRAVEAGARFIVSPVLDEEVVATALEHGVAAMPGVQTPSEMVRAHRMGAAMQKLFPAPANGPAYVRAALGPCPFLRLVPTSGVTPENVAQFIAAGVFAVGFVAPVFPAEVLAARDYIEVERLAREALAAAKAMPRAARPPVAIDPFNVGAPADTVSV